MNDMGGTLPLIEKAAIYSTQKIVLLLLLIDHISTQIM